MLKMMKFSKLPAHGERTILRSRTFRGRQLRDGVRAMSRSGRMVPEMVSDHALPTVNGSVRV